MYPCKCLLGRLVQCYRACTMLRLSVEELRACATWRRLHRLTYFASILDACAGDRLKRMRVDCDTAAYASGELNTQHKD